MYINEFYEKAPVDQWIKAENMSEDEKETARGIITTFFEYFDELGDCPSESVEKVFQGVVKMRCEIVPEFLKVVSIPDSDVSQLMENILYYENTIICHLKDKHRLLVPFRSGYVYSVNLEYQLAD